MTSLVDNRKLEDAERKHEVLKNSLSTVTREFESLKSELEALKADDKKLDIALKDDLERAQRDLTQAELEFKKAEYTFLRTKSHFRDRVTTLNQKTVDSKRALQNAIRNTEIKITQTEKEVADLTTQAHNAERFVQTVSKQVSDQAKT